MRRSLLPPLAALVLAACGAGNAADTDSAAPAAAAAGAADAALDPRAVRADTARIQGSPSAKVWMLEVSDFQCPYCKVWHDDVYPQIVREYVETGRVRLAYVHFPLRNHANALVAAEATMCAGAQGAFWPYHDRLFAAQEALTAASQPRPLLDSLARAQDLDAAAFGQCLDDGVMRPVVLADAERMQQAGVNATPTFFINGTVIAGAQPIASFRRALDAALAAADSAAR